MFVLGILGSPRKKGNTELLLSAFLEGVKEAGGKIKFLNITERNISPCTECNECQKTGFCSILDDMQEIYILLKQADAIVLATPVFFYGVTAQLKAFIDRCQTFWVQRYIFKLNDPKASFRLGFLITVGATKGQNLFSCVELTAKYFFKAIGAAYKGMLGFRKIEAKGDILHHPTALKEAYKKGKQFVEPFTKRKKICFCSDKTYLSQMAEVFTQYYAGRYLEAVSIITKHIPKIEPLLTKIMEEKGIDLKYYRAKDVNEIEESTFDLLIQINTEITQNISAKKIEHWHIKISQEENIENLRKTRDEIENQVKMLIKNL